MPLSPGDKIGHFEVLSLLGRGGMGEVYKARDTRLDRIVALKVSAAQFSERFEREAKAIGALNHPNICQLYDVGSNYLVMEYIEGTPLKGPLPLDQGLKYAAQICDALDAAHTKGITHRDLKPVNILVTKAGVKLLDFGLAKLASVGSGQAAKPNDATLTMALTGRNEIVGTLYYMSPEQLQAQATGQEIDGRSDIFSFGLVLYEMLTGKRAFEGSSPASVIAAIMERPVPSISTVAPPGLDWVMQTCLAKDPDERWQSARDLKRQLERVASASAETASTSLTTRSPFNRLPWIAAGLLAVSTAVALWAPWRAEKSAGEARTYKLQLEPPEGGQFIQAGTSTGGFAVSPNGRMVAFVASVKGVMGLWVQPLDGEATLLPGTEGARFPFWSPDSRSIAFFAGGKLLRTNVTGGTPLILCEIKSPRGGTWAGNGFLVIGTYPSSGLVTVPESGGPPTTLTIVEPNANHLWPQVLPGGRLLYLASDGNLRSVVMSTIDNIRQKTRIPVTDSNALSTPTADGKNYLLWLRGAALLAQEFDPGSLKFSGAPQVIANPVGTSGNTAFMHVSASNTGVLVYHRAGLTRFTWFDRTGRSQGDFGEPADYGTFRLSPDGRVVAASKLTPGGSDLWMIDLNRGISTPFSVGPSSHLYPVWSSNNDAVVFEGPRFGLMRKATSGATKEQDILPPSGLQIPHDISRDGKTLIYSSQQRIWAIAVTLDGKPQADAKPRLYLEKGSNTNSPRFSPEPTPRWVAYQSNDSGRDEIEIQSYPEPHGTIRISPSGGRWPHWSPDGRELFYISAENKLMAVDLKTTGSTLEPSVPRELFMLPGADNSFSPYEVSPDGQRFLIRSPAGQADRTLTVVVNWTGLLRQAPPAE